MFGELRPEFGMCGKFGKSRVRYVWLRRDVHKVEKTPLLIGGAHYTAWISSHQFAQCK